MVQMIPQGLIEHPTKALLYSGDVLLSGEYFDFPKKDCFLKLQRDGNLVMHQGTPNAVDGAIWSTGTSVGQGDYYALLQGDGNFVVYARTPINSQGSIYSSLSVNEPSEYFLGMEHSGWLIIAE